MAHSLLVISILSVMAAPAPAAERFVTLVSTTSTRDSGLLDAILPRFTERTGIAVRVVAVGTGRALELARRGDGDLLLVHAPEAERRFVEAGYGIDRREVMRNDFILVGPRDDPAGVRGREPLEALTRIAADKRTFASRGDDSGTHKAELRLWGLAGIDPARASGSWYRETGTGMGATLNTAAELRAYTLVDRGTWLSFKNRRDLEPLLPKRDVLANPYSTILVNPERHPHVKREDALSLADWLVSEEGQETIGGYRVGDEVLFYPSASPTLGAAPPR